MSITLTAEDFGQERYGIHISDREDDWGWYAFGHHEPHRVVAAINHLSRENGIQEDLRDAFTAKDLIEGVEHKWATNIRPEGDGYCWDWVEPGTPWAVAITEVSS